MAKRALRRPQLPPGRRLDLFLFLQDLVLRTGDQSVAEIARHVGVSHQTIYKALTGPKVPSRDAISHLATYLDSLSPDDVAHRILEMWADAVAEERTPAFDQPVTERGRFRPAQGLRELGALLRQARQQSGMPQAELARHLNWRQPAISRLEAGVRTIHRDELEAWLLAVDPPKHVTDTIRELYRRLDSSRVPADSGHGEPGRA